MKLTKKVNYEFELDNKFTIKNGALFDVCGCGGKSQLMYANTHFVFYCKKCKSLINGEKDGLQNAYGNEAFNNAVYNIPCFHDKVEEGGGF